MLINIYICILGRRNVAYVLFEACLSNKDRVNITMSLRVSFIDEATEPWHSTAVVVFLLEQMLLSQKPSDVIK